MVEASKYALTDDPEYSAFKKAEMDGEFLDLKPGTWVAFFDAKLIATSAGIDELCRDLVTRDLDGDVYVTQVNLEKTVKQVKRESRMVQAQE